MCPSIDKARLRQTLADYALIGGTENDGVTRLALSDDDRRVRERFRDDVEALGLELRVDDFGNMIATLNGSEHRKPIQIGSHLDSVTQGGRFDGALGVLGGLEIVRTLLDAGVHLHHPVQLINWTNEEGVRFEPAMMGSGVAYGVFDHAWAIERRDRDGFRLGDELERIGYRGDAQHRVQPGAAYLELHIEQGPILDDDEASVGIVEGILGITWINVRLSGQADHAGPSPMSLRRDALAAAAAIISMVESLVTAEGPPTVGTIGRLTLRPNLINMIPGTVEFSIDLRHQHTDGLESLVQCFTEQACTIAEQRGVGIDLDRFWTSEPTPFNPDIINAIETAARRQAPASRRLWSGAGHDAKYAADAGPAGMIFIRSIGGLSHCEAEFSQPDDIGAGVETLFETVLSLDALR